MAVSILVASVGYVTVEAMQRDANQALLNDLFRPKSQPPARMIVCEETMDAACAQEAAERSFATFAWLDEPTGYRLAWVLATEDPKVPPSRASTWLAPTS